MKMTIPMPIHPSTGQKLDYLQKFAHGPISIGCSHMWMLFPGGVQLRAWGGTQQIFNRRLSWETIDTARRSVLEALINDVFMQVRKADEYAAKMRNGKANGKFSKPERAQNTHVTTDISDTGGTNSEMGEGVGEKAG
jgi:hypothetical protein